MSGQLSVTYFHHSGFSVTCAKTLMIFDYWRGENQELHDDLLLTEKELRSYEQILFFVSHTHPDHLDEVIYDFRDVPGVHYIKSFDMPDTLPGDAMAVGDTRMFGDVKVTACPSTDLGVSYYVEFGELHIFHAGDLNLWHWREESTLRQITQAENLYYDAVNTLVGKQIDLCMFPVDPRLGGMYEAGANHLIMTCKPRVFIPMHWHGRTEIANDFARRCRTKFTEGLALTKPRERAEIDFEPHGINIHVFLTAEKEDVLKRRKRSDSAEDFQRPLSSFEKDDIFAESDLPIDSMSSD